MKWISHKLVTFAGMYTLTHNVGLSMLTAVCSVFPDNIEFMYKHFTSRRIHRMESHYFLPYLIIFVLSCGYLYNIIGISPIQFSLNDLPMLSIKQIPSITIGYLMLSISLGSLFHILEDSVCGTVPSLTLHSKRFGKVFFKVGSIEEYCWVFIFCTLTLVPVLLEHVFN